MKTLGCLRWKGDCSLVVRPKVGAVVASGLVAGLLVNSITSELRLSIGWRGWLAAAWEPMISRSSSPKDGERERGMFLDKAGFFVGGGKVRVVA